MSGPAAGLDPALGAQLVLDELFDLSLYTALRGDAAGEVRRLLDELIAIERRHLSGMDVRKRILTNPIIITAAVGVSYGIGTLVKALWGISV